jgi:transaldolase/glucose-6-phosphate isomerase
MRDNQLLEVGKQRLILGPYAHVVEARLRSWTEANLARRIWQKDGTVWVPNPKKAAKTPELTNRLGWLTIPEVMHDSVDQLSDFAKEIRAEGFTDVVLLGMGGSSLAPEVFMTTFGNAPGHPPLTVLDSTHPASVQHVADGVDLANTLFLVSSKSGTTAETLSFFRFFYNAVAAVREDPGQNFVAITDPSSPLETLAAENKLRRVFSSPPDVGGRYSALTNFGLVPAALIGVNLYKLLDRAVSMLHASHYSVPVADNPGLALGAAMGELALAGRDKVTFFASPRIAAFGSWVEQLIAESTGKNGTGILPIPDEKLTSPDRYNDDRVFVYVRMEGDENDALDKGIDALEAAGHPVVRIALDEKEDIGAEFFRWEMATAGAGAVLGINPFDQPNVEAAKVKARELLKAFRETGRLPSDTPVLTENDIEVFGGTGKSAGSMREAFSDFLQLVRPGDYAALMAYVPRTVDTDRVLESIRLAIRNNLKVATSIGYGPRFLHSTGQLHKGDGNKGLFIQVTHEPEGDIPIPGEAYSFGTLVTAQALGDYQALAERGRRLIRSHIKGDVTVGLTQLRDSLGIRKE